MAETPPLPIQAAVAQLWKGKYGNEQAALGSPAFTSLLNTCIKSYAKPGSPNEVKDEADRGFHKSALQNLFRNVGAPWYKDQVGATSETIARTIHQAYSAQTFKVSHLCPLDRADTDNLPKVEFGPCQMTTLSANSLAELVRLGWLLNFSRNYVFDTKRFSQFSWLVVRETVPTEPIGKRSDPTRGGPWPSFYELLNMKLGDIDLISAHRAELPEIVEQAVFVLLLYPWENVVEHAEFDWRPFRIPWIYSVRSDPFADPDPPPSADSLSWVPDIYYGPSGDVEYEVERPEKWELKKGHLKDLESFLSQQWKLTAKVCPVTDAKPTAFNPLVRHFMVQAFRAERFDEFLYHIVAIEAALARRGRGTTEKLKQKIEKLLNDKDSAKRFGCHYDLRSDFVHGRPLGSELRTGELKELRSLTQNVIRELVSFVAKHPKLDRDRLLDKLD